jgi:hypothetical protein
MTRHRQFGENRRERGAALLIAIFALLLISVVAIALVVSSGTDSALASNYRTSTSAYYAALAGLEEGRGRLLWKNPDFFNKTVANFVPNGQGVLAANQVLYIVNPAGGPAIVPNNPADPYADNEYGTEFDWGLGGAAIQGPVNSDSQAGPYPGPLFKWVRVNPVTEHSMGDIAVDGPHTPDRITPLFYDGTGLNRIQSGNQALEITALAVLPDGARKMLQYVVAPVSFNLALSLPAALTLLGSTGNNVLFNGPNNTSFSVNGNDQFGSGTCVPGANPVFAIGYANGSDASGINATPVSQYSGLGGSSTAPSVGNVTLPASMQTPAALNALLQDIVNNADVTLSPASPGTAVPGSQLPAAMNASNPMTVVVNGDLDLTNWHGTGYGLLLVTGTLTYDPDATWNGIVLVVGKGDFVSTRGGTNQLNGAMLIAKTVDSSGNPLAAFGPSSFSQTGGNPSGRGIFYSTCNIIAAQQPSTYKVLSFREIFVAN